MRPADISTSRFPALIPSGGTASTLTPHSAASRRPFRQACDKDASETGSSLERMKDVDKKVAAKISPGSDYGATNREVPESPESPEHLISRAIAEILVDSRAGLQVHSHRPHDRRGVHLGQPPTW
jgi:hypothetical protein